MHDSLITGLEERGYSVHYDRDMTMDRLPSVISRYHGIVINSKIKMFESLIDAGSSLEHIVRLGSGLEIIDVVYAQSKGIHVINTPEGNCNAVGEHALGMLLALQHNILNADQELRELIWNREKHRGDEITGKTIGIVGFGHTGKAFASKLKSWDVELIAYDKYHPQFGEAYDYVASVSGEDIRRKSDIISFHLPLTPETQHLVDGSYLDQCNDGVVIVNTSRGSVIRIDSLMKALQDGRIKGACLDVFENEKTSTFSAKEKELYEALYLRRDVVLTPHIAGWTHQSLRLIAATILKKIDAID